MAEQSIYSRKTWRRRDKSLPPTPQHKWNSENRQKLKAHGIVRQALRTGALKRGRCEECGSFRTEAHHANYATPLLVSWLCRLHHQQLHAALRRATPMKGLHDALVLAPVDAREPSV